MENEKYIESLDIFSDYIENCKYEFDGDTVNQKLTDLSDCFFDTLSDSDSSPGNVDLLRSRTWSDHIKYFFRRIEQIIFGKTCADFYDNIKFTSKCSQVFQKGDPVFQCKDCKIDNTCVFCFQCFLNSAHTNHRYKFYKSAGEGGQCDCGDPESWKFDSICKIHANENNIKVLPENRQLLLQQICLFFFNMFVVTMESIFDENYYNDEVPHCLVVLNDESHSFSDVIETFTEVFKMSESKASSYARYIDSYGLACLVIRRRINGCIYFSDSIKVHYRQKYNMGSLKTKIMTCKAYITIRFFHTFLDWINSLAEFSDQLTSIFTSLVCSKKHWDELGLSNQTKYQSVKSFLSYLLVYNTLFWKEFRTSSLAFILKLIPNEVMKSEFAEAIGLNCVNIYLKEFSDDHDHTFSVLSLYVQVFSSPSLALTLIKDYLIVEKMMEVFVELSLRIGSEWKNLSLHFRHLTGQIENILQHIPNEWDDKLRNNIFNAFMRLLLCINDDKEIKQLQIAGIITSSRLEFVEAFDYHICLEQVQTALLKWIKNDDKLALMCMNELISVIKKGIEFQNFDINNIHIVSKAEQSLKAVKLFLPHYYSKKSIFARSAKFLTILIANNRMCGCKFSALIESKEKIMIFFERNFHSLAFLSQVISGVYPLGVGDRINFYLRYLSESISNKWLSYECDKMALQTCVLNGDEELTFVYMKNLFFHSLDNKSLKTYTKKAPKNPQKLKSKFTHFAALAQELLFICYQVVAHRFSELFGCMDKNYFQYHFSHLLCFKKNFTLEELEVFFEKLCENNLLEFDNMMFEEIINTIMEKKISQLNPATKYTLKDEFYNKLNKYYIGYNTQQSKSIGVIIENKLKPSTDKPIKDNFSYLPEISFEILDKFINFCANNHFKHFLINCVLCNILFMDLNYSIEIDIDLIIHICLLLIHDATKINQSRTVEKVRNFFLVEVETFEGSKSLYSVLKCIGQFELTSSESVLYSSLMKCLESFLSVENHNVDSKNVQEVDKTSKVDYAKLAMDKMKNMQQIFKSKNEKELKLLETAGSRNIVNKKKSVQGKLIGLNKFVSNEQDSVCRTVCCILCQKDFEPENETYEEQYTPTDFLLLCKLFSSNVIYGLKNFFRRKNKSGILSNIYKAAIYSIDTDNSYVECPLISGCGHCMHKNCFDRYVEHLKQNGLYVSPGSVIEHECAICYSITDMEMSLYHVKSLKNDLSVDEYDVSKLYINILELIKMYKPLRDSIVDKIECELDSDYIPKEAIISTKTLRENEILTSINALVYNIQSIDWNLRIDKVSVLSEDFLYNYKHIVVTNFAHHICYIINNVADACYEPSLDRIFLSEEDVQTQVLMMCSLGESLEKIIQSNNLEEIDFFKMMSFSYFVLIFYSHRKIKDESFVALHAYQIEKFCSILFYMYNSLQCLCCLEKLKNAKNYEMITDIKKKIDIQNVISFHNFYCSSFNISSKGVDDETYFLYVTWMRSMLPFLRCSAIFYHFMNIHVSFPTTTSTYNEVDEFVNLVTLLDLPLDIFTFYQSFKSSHPSFDPKLYNIQFEDGTCFSSYLDHYTMGVPNVFKLPDTLAQLMLYVNDFNVHCSMKKFKLTGAELCILCGTVICVCSDCKSTSLLAHSSTCLMRGCILFKFSTLTCSYSIDGKIGRSYPGPYVLKKTDNSITSTYVLSQEIYQDLVKTWRNNLIPINIYSDIQS